MYQNIFITSRSETEPSMVYLWDDEEGLIMSPYAEFAYAYKRDPSGTYTSIYGEKLKKVMRPRYDEPGLYESDMARETRVLTDCYLDSDLPSKNHRVMYFDIEVSSELGFSKADVADQEITAIAYYDLVADKYVCHLLDKSGKMQVSEEGNETVISHITEVSLLESFLADYARISPTILTGWNIDFYDIPYLYNRLNRVLGYKAATSLSPVGLIKYSEQRQKYIIAGVSCLDYMALYKKFTYSQQPSYRLDAIGKAEVGKGKVEYEGTLDNLFNTDIKKFIEYNLRDVEIVVALDKKMKLIELARFICHIGHVPYEDFGYSSKFIEGTIVTYLHRKNIIVSNKPVDGRERFNAMLDDDEEGFTGAYVKAPVPGLYEWVYSLDLQSLYPSIIMSLNISPETKMGRIYNWDVDKHMKGELPYYEVQLGANPTQRMTKTELKNWLHTHELSLSSNGILYSNVKTGIIPEILDKWFAERVEYKNTMKKYIKEGNTELADFYDRRQHVQKILLNSIYGVLGLPIFRFYDLDNALAVTATGQDVIKTTAKFINTKYEKLTGVKTDHCVYIDTDSVYFSADPLLDKSKDAKAQTILIAKGMEKDVNGFYDTMAKMLFNCDTHRFYIKGESVMQTGFWVAKKRYAMKKVFDLETDKDMDKLAVKGLDVVRSSFPPAFKTVMSDILLDILNRVPKKDVDTRILNFRNAMETMPWTQIARNVGVKNISQYEDENQEGFDVYKPKTPAHVRASINYNRLLKKLGVKNQKISDGDKIKYTYLKKNPYGVEMLAMKTYDDPKELVQLVEKYIDHEALFEKELYNKLEDFYAALNWGILPTEINQTAFEFFDFV